MYFLDKITSPPPVFIYYIVHQPVVWCGDSATDTTGTTPSAQRRMPHTHHSRSVTVGSVRQHAARRVVPKKATWSGTTRRNTVMGLDNGIGSGRTELSKLNSLTMVSKTRTEQDRRSSTSRSQDFTQHYQRRTNSDDLAIQELSSLLAKASQVPLVAQQSAVHQDRSTSATKSTGPRTQRPPPPSQPAPFSSKRRISRQDDYSRNLGSLDLSEFELRPTLSTPTASLHGLSATSPSSSSSISPPSSTTATSLLHTLPTSRKPPPPPGPPPPSAKRKKAPVPSSPLRHVHDEMDGMRNRIADITHNFKHRDEEQTTAIAALQKQTRQLERANAHLRRERDRILGQQRSQLIHQENSNDSQNTHLKIKKQTIPAGPRKSVVQRGLEVQLQQARAQLSKEKNKRKEEVQLFTLSKRALETQIADMEKKEQDRRWAREQATTISNRETHRLEQQITSLTCELQEARSQLRASAAASMQFDVHKTTSPKTHQEEFSRAVPLAVPAAFDLTTKRSEKSTVRTPHPKRAPPVRPNN